MLYSCTHMATVGVKGLKLVCRITGMVVIIIFVIFFLGDLRNGHFWLVLGGLNNMRSTMYLMTFTSQP